MAHHRLGRRRPTPSPVWFAADGEDLVVFTAPGSRKVHNIEQRSLVSLHFNSDPEGHDAFMIAGEATVRHGRNPSTLRPYMDKYREPLDKLGMSVEQLDAEYNTELRIRPIRIGPLLTRRPSEPGRVPSVDGTR